MSRREERDAAARRRDNPAGDGVRQQGQRPLARVRGDQRGAARSREKRLIVPTEVLQHAKTGCMSLITAVISDGLKEAISSRFNPG